jgi:hypothetical protein
MDVFWWIVCPLFFLIGLLVLVGSTRAIWTGCRAASWPHTTATLLSAEFKKYESDSADSVTTFEVLVRYEYWVAGQRYEGTRIHPAYSASSDWNTHIRLSERLQPSRRVRVYYRADRPAESTLCVGFFSRTLAVFFAGFTFTALGVCIPLGSYSLLAPEWALLAIGVGLLPAFYFVFAGRDPFAKGIRLVAQRSSVRKR